MQAASHYQTPNQHEWKLCAALPCPLPLRQAHLVQWMQRVMTVLTSGPRFLSSTVRFTSTKRLRSLPNTMAWQQQQQEQRGSSSSEAVSDSMAGRESQGRSWWWAGCASLASL
jgi:hypothetical protein